MSFINLDGDLTVEQIDRAMKKLELKRNDITKSTTNLNAKSKALLNKIEKYVKSYDSEADPYIVGPSLTTRIEEDLDYILNLLKDELGCYKDDMATSRQKILEEKKFLAECERDLPGRVKEIKLHKEKCKLLEQLKKELAK